MRKEDDFFCEFCQSGNIVESYWYSLLNVSGEHTLCRNQKKPMDCLVTSQSLHSSLVEPNMCAAIVEAHDQSPT